MKKLTFLIVLAFIIQATVSSQPCLPEGITFTTQNQIDNFQTNYPGCTEIEGNVIISGAEITNLKGLSILESIWGYLVIKNNNLLINLTGLDTLSSIGMFNIKNNNSLTSLSGLGTLSSIKGSLAIEFNNSLINLSGLNAVTSINGLLYIGSNDSLTSLTGLDALTYIGDYMEIRNNDALTNLNGLEALTSIGGDLWIYDNNELISLSGLVALSSIGGELYIGANYNLISLVGIENIDHNTITGIHISYNESLSTCEVQSICDYLSNPMGPIDIQSNATGCNSPEEVEEACESIGIPNINVGYEFSIYPNPAEKEIFISVKNGITINEVNIYNQIGQKVLHENRITNKIDVSILRQGMYIIELVTNELKIREKLIIR